MVAEIGSSRIARMKNRFRTLLAVSLLIPSFGVPTMARAEFYLRPRAGAVLPLHGGDTSYSLGATAGYQWTDFFATEASYSRLFGTGSAPDGDLVQGEGIVSLPLLPIVTPFVSGGVGAVHTSGGGSSNWNSMLLLGAGATLDKILFLQLGAGVSYAIVRHGDDFFEPYVAIGIVF
jgi:hypothetical protein